MLDSAVAVCENCAGERPAHTIPRMDKVNLVYLDDSEQAGRFQVIGAAIIHDSSFGEVEKMLGLTILDLVPEDLRDDFEFHACDLLNGNKPFQNVTAREALAIFARAVEAIELCKVSVVYGAVDLRKLYASVYSSANAVDIAFRLCAQRVEEWFDANAAGELGLMISDD